MMIKSITFGILILLNFGPIYGIELNPAKAKELLDEFIAHPIEVIKELENYKTSDFLTAFGSQSLANNSLPKECNEELMFLGYGVLDVAKHFEEDDYTGPSIMTDQEKNKYLMPMMDSAGKVGSGIARGHLLNIGAFSECKSVNMYSTTLNRTIRGDYYRILFDIKMHPHSFNDSCQIPQIGVDICLPWSCRNEDLTDYFRSAIGASEQLSPVCSVRNVNGRIPNYSFGTFVVLAMSAAVILTALAAGTIDYYYEHRRSKLDYQRKERSSKFGWKVFMAFSFYRNFLEIFNTKQTNKEGQVTSLNCIRSISTVWVIIGHCAAMLMVICSNPADLFDFTKTYLGTLIVNAYLSVDTFFFISAFLLSFLWFKKLEKQRKAVLSPGGWLMFYVHRIVRLTPVYYVTVLIYTFVFSRSMVDMPIFMSPAIKEETCGHNFWLNLLYIQNIVDPGNICYVITWYLATDLQLFILSPVILLSFAIGGKRVGFLISMLLFAGSTAFNAYQIVFWHFPPTDYDFGPKDPRYDPEAKRYDLWNYYNPLIRCQIYIMGLILGYYMRRVPKININPRLDWIMWILSLGSMAFVVLIIQNYTSGPLWSPLQTALYSCFSRVIWGFALSWIVISTCYRKSIINDFMSLPLWIPLARLSFCAYLVHIMVAGYFFGKSRSDLNFSTLSYFFLNTVLPVTIISFIVAIFWSALFEIPFMKIEALLFGGAGRKSTVPQRKEAEEAPYVLKIGIDSFEEGNTRF